MILLDQRHVDKQGGGHFVSRFSGLGVPVWLEQGDAVFWDRSGARSVAVEIKSPLDLAVCVETTGRLVQQLRAAREAGHQHYCLIIEGIINTDDEGYLSQFKYGKWVNVLIPGQDPHPILYRRIENALNSLDILEGVQVKRAADDREVAAQIMALYHWWQRDFSDHTTTTADRMYQPVSFGVGEVPLVRRVAKELKGIGLDKSRGVSDRFQSVYEMALAGESEWRKVKGIGVGLAGRVVREIRGGGE